MVITLRTIKAFLFCFTARTMPATDMGMPAIRENSNNMSPALIRNTASSKGIFIRGSSRSIAEGDLNTKNKSKPRTVVIKGIRIRILVTVFLPLPKLSISVPFFSTTGCLQIFFFGSPQPPRSLP